MPKILIVDDEADMRTYLKAVLEDNKYETVEAADGEEGYSLLQDIIPDLVVLDIIMPKESGVKFYRQLRKNPDLSNIPVIIVSGAPRYNELFARDHATMPKPFAFIEKPPDRDLLLEKIKAAVG